MSIREVGDRGRHVPVRRRQRVVDRNDFSNLQSPEYAASAAATARAGGRGLGGGSLGTAWEVVRPLLTADLGIGGLAGMVPLPVPGGGGLRKAGRAVSEVAPEVLRLFRGTSGGSGYLGRGLPEAEMLREVYDVSPFGPNVLHVTPDKALASSFGTDVAEFVADLKPGEILDMDGPLRQFEPEVLADMTTGTRYEEVGGLYLSGDLDADEMYRFLGEAYDDEAGQLFYDSLAWEREVDMPGMTIDMLYRENGTKALRASGVIGEELGIIDDSVLRQVGGPPHPLRGFAG